MKIHKTVNPKLPMKHLLLEGEKHLIVVDPGSHWEAILSDNREHQQTYLRYSIDPRPL